MPVAAAALVVTVPVLVTVEAPVACDRIPRAPAEVTLPLLTVAVPPSELAKMPIPVLVTVVLVIDTLPEVVVPKIPVLVAPVVVTVPLVIVTLPILLLPRMPVELVPAVLT